MLNSTRYLGPEQVLVIYDDDLPSMASHFSQKECGYSIYRGVLVQWDEDQDVRVLDFLNDLEETQSNNLAVVQEHEGTIALLWKQTIPDEFQEGKDVLVAGDVWQIIKSISFGEPA